MILEEMISENPGSEKIAEEEIFLPDYMRDLGPANHYYGTLTYSSRTNMWNIKGEPCVCQMAKRLFPGCVGRRRGSVRFAANKRTIGDLNWLMLRYPLEIRSKAKWEQAIEEARNHVLNRERINKHPIKVTPPNTYFKGTLREFQKEGLGYLLQNNRMLLADEMGLGKTVQALAFLSKTQLFPVLLVVPPHLIRNWQREIDRFLRVRAKGDNVVAERDRRSEEGDRYSENSPAEASRLQKVIPKDDEDADSAGDAEDVEYADGACDIEDAARASVHVIQGLRPYPLPTAHIYIIHYLLLRGWKNELPQMGFKAIIFDEIQELRHSGTEKYSAASLAADSCDTIIGLSGTPIYNRGAEIWNVMNIIDYHSLGDWDSFTREWCYGYRSDIVKDPVVLGEYLKREGLLYRRTKEQVLKELPPKRRLVQEIDSDIRVYDALMEGTLEKVRQLDIADNLEKGRLVEQISQEERQATGIAKAPYVCSFVKALLEGEEKVLLFAHHHKVMDIYRKLLKSYKPVFITGRETEKQKDASLKAFMEGKTSLCCISLRAAAGLNLQRASCVVFGELDWSPAVHSQAEDRAHRIGQQDSILCYYLVGSKGSDQDIQEALGLKVSQFVGIMGDKPESEEARMIAQYEAARHIDKIIQRLRQKAYEKACEDEDHD